ncbi:hypothetical protein [Tumebacillus flagellatus]|uniref:ABC transporter permease n=1 Tax=Tumebacillus flagellatus TaxID=1157490 RepID=A0A074LQK8_9BACL|nr:hypothetical protein [Tumebacillus flagellatus]KEO82780.1 hypothetical protein EL26_13605 [Tumebacillus flagellatus]
MSNAQKALVMAAGIFLAIALITIAVVMFISAQEATKTAQENFSGIQNELSSTAFNVYDGTVVTGSQVTNAIRKYNGREEFGIHVITGRDANGAWYGDVISEADATLGDVVLKPSATGMVQSGGINYMIGTAALADDVSQAQYVNPSGRFNSTVIRDKSNVVKEIRFVQQAE